MIYLDNAGTTKPFEEVIDIYNKMSRDYYFNPSATYASATSVAKIVSESRKVIANKLHCADDEIYFTSGATESNNWALECGRKIKNGNVVISAGEHSSVYEQAMRLKSRGIEVRIVRLTPDGIVDYESLQKAIDKNTALVSIIHCSNETGAINNLKKIGTIVKNQSDALFHADGVQAFCKIPVNLIECGVDLYSISGHKIGGPKGIGALFIKKNRHINPFLVGGGQEKGLRSGTENTSAIAAFAKASDIFEANHDTLRIFNIRNYIITKFKECGSVIINAEDVENSGYIISASILGIKSEILQNLLFKDGVIIGLGSACSAKTSENRVLSALGRNKKEIQGNIRISLSPTIKHEDIVIAMDKIQKNIKLLRGKINE